MSRLFLLPLLLSFFSHANELHAPAASAATAWDLYARARAAHFGPGADAALALALYRDSAALNAGPGSGAAYAALARLYETGWDGRVSAAPPPAPAAPAPSASAAALLWGGELLQSASVAWASSEAGLHWLLARLWRLVDFYGPPWCPRTRARAT